MEPLRYRVELEEDGKTTLLGLTRYSLDAITMAKNHVEKTLPHLMVKVIDSELEKEIGYAYVKQDGSTGWRNG